MENKKLMESINKLGADVVANVVEELLKLDKKATSNLINSVRYEILETSNGILLNIMASDYFKYVDTGRGSGKKAPPKKALLPWIEARGIKFKSPKGVPYSDAQTAFVIAKSIGEKGIKPTGIKQKVIDNILSNKEQVLALGLKIDIKEYIKKNIII